MHPDKQALAGALKTVQSLYDAKEREAHDAACELANIDHLLERRPALDGLGTRYAKVRAALDTAAKYRLDISRITGCDNAKPPTARERLREGAWKAMASANYVAEAPTAGFTVKASVDEASLKASRASEAYRHTDLDVGDTSDKVTDPAWSGVASNSKDVQPEVGPSSVTHPLTATPERRYGWTEVGANGAKWRYDPQPIDHVGYWRSRAQANQAMYVRRGEQLAEARAACAKASELLREANAKLASRTALTYSWAGPCIAPGRYL